jgi:hypothetical protein
MLANYEGVLEMVENIILDNGSENAEEHIALVQEVPSTKKSVKACLKTNLPMTTLRRDKFQVLKDQYISNSKLITDEYIKRGLVAILPDISKEMANETDPERIFNWVSDSMEYAKILFSDFQYECSRQILALDRIRLNAQLSKKLRIYDLLKMPEDVVIYTQQYLMPKTRLLALEARVPDIRPLLQQMTIPWLNGILKNAVFKSTNTISSKIFEHYPHGKSMYNKCIDYIWNKLRPKMHYRGYKKGETIEKILIAIATYRDPLDCPTNFLVQLLHKQAFHIFHTVLYVHGKFIEKKKRGSVNRVSR